MNSTDVGFYIDASVLFALYVRSQFTESASQAVEGREVVVSNWTVAEAMSAINATYRAADLSKRLAQESLSNLNGDVQERLLSVEPVHEADVVQVVQWLSVVTKRSLKAPDAIHVAIAQRLRLQFLTADYRQSQFARSVGLYVVLLR
jgi:predicted nucleic acid-binding protein